MEKHGQLVTLECTTEGAINDCMYVPYGTLAIPIVLPDLKDSKVPTLGGFWVKTIFEKTMAAMVPPSEWAAIDLLNRPYLTHLSGQRLWAQRLNCYDALKSDRETILADWADSPTVPGGPGWEPPQQVLPGPEQPQQLQQVAASLGETLATLQEDALEPTLPEQFQNEEFQAALGQRLFDAPTLDEQVEALDRQLLNEQPSQQPLQKKSKKMAAAVGQEPEAAADTRALRIAACKPAPGQKKGANWLKSPGGASGSAGSASNH